MINIDIINQLDGYIGWKDRHGKFLGCNNHLARVLQLGGAQNIIGLNDHDLPDFSAESYQLHHQYDQAALCGQTVKYIHHSNHPYDGRHYQVVKKPLYNQRKIIGIIFHCQTLIDANTANTSITPNPYKLSKRELECLQYLLKGSTSKEIAASTGLTKRTVDFYIENIKNKMSCRTRTEVILKAVKINQHN